MTATNKCYNFVGFRCRVPLIKCVADPSLDGKKHGDSLLLE